MEYYTAAQSFQDNASAGMNWGDMSRCVRRLKALSFPILGHLYVILHYSSLELEAGEKKYTRYYTVLISR